MTTKQPPGQVDAVTGLAMAEHLDALTCALWEAATAAEDALCVMLIEVDDFRRYRDSYGAEATELLMQRAAAVIRASSRAAEDRVGRLGTCEFILMLPGATLDAAYIAGERILRAIRALEMPHRGSTVSNYVTVSIGAASCRPQPGDSPVPVTDAATSALWAAKRGGHNRIAAFELSSNAGAEESLRAIG